MARYRNNNLSKSLKDYAVPIIGLVLILILLFSVFSGTNDVQTIQDNKIDNSTDSWETQIELWNQDTKAYIVYANWKKSPIEDNTSFQKWEKIVVESGNVTISFPLFANMKLSENWELLYKEDGSLLLNSWNLWVESMKNIDFAMKYAEVSIPSWDIVNLAQNDLESTIYSIDWEILVTNLAWKSVQIEKWKKIAIKSKDSTSWDLNLDTLKNPIDYFKTTPWFKENNWDKILSDNIDNLSLSSSSWSLEWDNLDNIDSKSLINFENLTDESYSKTNIIDIKWRYSPLKVWKITINNLDTKLNSELWTFSLKWFILQNKVNDIVVKVFDKNKNLISKKVLTIYSSNPSNTSVWNNNIKSKVENFAVKPTDFYIYEPTKTWKITTKSSQITIRWKVTNKEVSSVLVNGYKLKSFNGSTWRYHAFVEQGTLKNWANIYEIKYLDKNWKIIYKEYYSIYKESNTPKKVIKKISDEVKVN